MGIAEIFSDNSDFSEELLKSNAKKMKEEKIIHKVHFDFTEQHWGDFSERKFYNIYAHLLNS